MNKLRALPFAGLGDLGKNVREIVVDVTHREANDIRVQHTSVGNAMEQEENDGEPGSLHGDEDELHIDVRILPAPNVYVHGVEGHPEKARGWVQTRDDLDETRRTVRP